MFFKQARFVGAVVSLTAVAAGATTLVRLGVDDLSRSSDSIVQGTIKKVESRWTSDGTRIVTDVEVQVDDTLKGQPPRTIVIQQPGGEVGDIGQKVAGLASFAPSEEVVLFLDKKGGDRFAVTGMAQGKYRIERSADKRKVMAVPEKVGDARLLDPNTMQSSSSLLQSTDLATLKAQIKAALAQPDNKSENRKQK